MADTDIEPAEPLQKKAKVEEIPDKNDSIHEEITDLSEFIPGKLLNINTSRKSVCLQGTFNGKDGVGIVLLEKTAFSGNNLSDYFSKDTSLEKVFSNDIYGNYKCFPKVELNDIKTTIIHPATKQHIAKHASQEIYLIDETYDIYKNIVLPHIEKEFLSLEWVYNILDHKQELKRIVFEDPDPTTGFILLPDLKWDGKTKETLYLLAIVRKRNIKSLRDLTEDHLPLLKNIYEKGCEIIEKKYGLRSSQLRIYFHYHPSFYHLHIHFTYLKHDVPGIYTEKSHMLSNVISNITLLPDYYQKVTLPFVVRENEYIFAMLVEKKLIEPIEKDD